MARTIDRPSKVREIFLALPDTKETPTWGSPHFRVGDKIFGGMGEHDDGRVSIGFKLEMDHADALVGSDPRFTRAKYVGHKGWVDMDVSAVSDWEEVRTLVGESYRLIAPKRSLAKLGDRSVSGRDPGPTTTAVKTEAAAKSAAKKAAAKKAPAGEAPAQKGSAKKAPAKKAAAKKAPAKKAPANRTSRR